MCHYNEDSPPEEGSGFNFWNTVFMKYRLPQTGNNLQSNISIMNQTHSQSFKRINTCLYWPQRLHYCTTSIYENFLSLASLADRACAVSPFVNFSPSPSRAPKKSHPLTELPRQRNTGETGGGRGWGNRKIREQGTSHQLRPLPHPQACTYCNTCMWKPLGVTK
jgi:hypothetical protein